jgi:ligand-binding sensor domain-containing protein
MRAIFQSLTATFLAVTAFDMQGAAKTSLSFEQPVEIMRILPQGKAKLFITPSGVMQMKGNALTSIYTETDGILDAVVQDNMVFLATRKGLKRLDAGNGYKPQPTLFEGREISSLALDNKKRLWVGSMYQGAYVQQGPDSFELKLQIPSILSMASNTADTNVWVGTNVGLYRVGTGTFNTTRYAEEGYSGYELPDNVVEHLFADDLTNVWVLMPDNISFKKGNGFQGELPTFEFVGDKGNVIHSILAVRGDWYMFVTAKGVSYMPIRALQQEHAHATEEVHETHNTQARQAAGADLLAPKGWESEPVLRAEKMNGRVWFVTAKGCWSVSERKLAARFRG